MPCRNENEGSIARININKLHKVSLRRNYLVWKIYGGAQPKGHMIRLLVPIWRIPRTWGRFKKGRQGWACCRVRAHPWLAWSRSKVDFWQSKVRKVLSFEKFTKFMHCKFSCALCRHRVARFSGALQHCGTHSWHLKWCCDTFWASHLLSNKLSSFKASTYHFVTSTEGCNTYTFESNSTLWSFHSS